MKLADETRHTFCRISSKVIHAFGPVIRSAMEVEDGARFYDGAFFVYPADEGALCIACDGRVLVAFQDRTAGTNGSAMFRLPDALISACAPPSPTVGWLEGERREFEQPEWAQPRSVYLTSGGAFVLPAMHHPEDGKDPSAGHCLYTCIGDVDGVYRENSYREKAPRYDPRRILATLIPAPASVVMNPALVGLFSECEGIFNTDGVVHFRTNGPGSPISVILTGAPDFFGVIAPMRDDPVPVLPGFVADLKAAAEAPADIEPRAA